MAAVGARSGQKDSSAPGGSIVDGLNGALADAETNAGPGGALALGVAPCSGPAIGRGVPAHDAMTPIKMNITTAENGRYEDMYTKGYRTGTAGETRTFSEEYPAANDPSLAVRGRHFRSG